jgi:Skp family chaperone for outer membrane proteins
MSGTMRAAKVGFALIAAVSVGAVIFVHNDQKEEMRRLHEGVKKDAVRMKWRQSEIEKERLAVQEPGK